MLKAKKIKIREIQEKVKFIKLIEKKENSESELEREIEDLEREQLENFSSSSGISSLTLTPTNNSQDIPQQVNRNRLSGDEEKNFSQSISYQSVGRNQPAQNRERNYETTGGQNVQVRTLPVRNIEPTILQPRNIANVNQNDFSQPTSQRQIQDSNQDIKSKYENNNIIGNDNARRRRTDMF